jgi:hypothetical protein
VLLDLGGVLLVSSAADAPLSGTGSDLSGALVTSDRPVLAFAGHAAAFVPVTAGFADHLEESLPPVSAWGSEYFIARPVSPVGFGAKHYVKVLADAPTTLSTNPVVAGLTSVLAAGQSSVVEATVDFQLLASAPVAVAAFMEGSSRFSDQHGDPSQLIVVPSREAQRELDFIAPLRLAPITAQLIAPTGAAVTIDDAAVTGWSAIGTSGQSLAHHSLCCSDLHHASGTAPFTLSVIAYPPYTSYWYPGGFELADGLFGDGFESP